MDKQFLYQTNGLLFWSEEAIQIRQMFVDRLVNAVEQSLLRMNTAFKMIQCEAPILTPNHLISSNYTEEDYFRINEHLSLRPETTMGSYVYARHITNGYHNPKYKLPICVWQHGKSFRKEQDQSSKFMRLKEFYQLEFQILFSNSTSKDYYPEIVHDVWNELSKMLTGRVRVDKSDRLPFYSDETLDVICNTNNVDMEICSISRRKDYGDSIRNIEIAVGTDRCVYQYINEQ